MCYVVFQMFIEKIPSISEERDWGQEDKYLSSESSVY